MELISQALSPPYIPINLYMQGKHHNLTYDRYGRNEK